jgi:serine/threonine protein kinase
MTLTAGARLGPYEILASLGAGGMGEVYRARDAKLSRDVAIKVLPAEVSARPDALARFEREARAVAALSHPNILAIHDFGTEGGTAYAVTELLDGETLRDALAPGPLPVRRAVEYAIQMARGLAAAHDKGIVHRDLKPENVFITADERVKILDFGLARQDAAAGGSGTLAPTLNSPTEPGTVLGTVGYMAPEQVRGTVVDWRADIFSFGAVLYEMVTGQRAFHRETAAETMTAILREDLPDAAPERPIPPSVDRIVRHCLEKKPEARFRSAHDLAFALEAISGPSSSTTQVNVSIEDRSSRRWFMMAVAAMSIVVAAGLGAMIGRRSVGAAAVTSSPQLGFRQLSFRRGVISAARYAPDGKTPGLQRLLGWRRSTSVSDAPRVSRRHAAASLDRGPVRGLGERGNGDWGEPDPARARGAA